MSDYPTRPDVRVHVRGRAARWAIAMLVSSLAFSGCSTLFGKREPPIKRFLLESNPPQERPGTPQTAGPGREASSSLPVLVVGVPQARPGFDSPRMAYIRRPYALDYFSYHQWTDTPARLLLPLLIEAMEGCRCWQSVSTTPPPGKAGYRLEIDELTLAQIFTSSPSRVHLALHARLMALETGQQEAERRFERDEPAAKDTPYEGVVAASRATGSLLEALVRWTRQVTTPEPPPSGPPTESSRRDAPPSRF